VPLALQHLERCLVEKLQGEPVLEETEPDAGPRRVADILGRMRRSLENLVLASLEQQSPGLARRVNRFRFTFENLLELEPRVLQRVLRDIEADTLRLAMQGMDPDQHEIILGNMSERAAARLKEELESGPPAQLGDVEAAQQTMVAVARSLQERGEVQFTIGVNAGSEENELG
jgi:flagellar motor switch protein FliG